MVSNTTQVSEEMKQLEKFEVQIADYLGMSAEDLDPTLLLLKLKKKVLHDVDYSQSLVKLRKLHSLRLQYSRAQRSDGESSSRFVCLPVPSRCQSQPQSS